MSKPKISLKQKFVLGILIFLLILPFFARPVLAFETPNSTYYFQFEEAVKSDEMNLQSFVNEIMKAIPASVIYLISGSFTDRTQNPGLLSATGMFIAGVYASPPASGVQYFADMGRKLGIIKPVYAKNNQGMGFAAMAITIPIWTTFRNITYVLFVLILVAMGFAIMFRVKISPQAVITIQSALPRIVLALVLITFSYAIVGFLLDIMFFLNDLIVNIFFNPKSGLFIQLEIIGEIIRGGDIVGSWLGAPPPVGAIFTVIGLTLVPALLLVLIVLSFSQVVGIILVLIFALFILIILFRLAWAILKAFTMIVVNLVFAPFRILIGVLPGSDAIGSWFRDLLANIAVFPAILIMLLLSSYFIFAGIIGVGKLFFDRETWERALENVLNAPYGGVVGPLVPDQTRAEAIINNWQLFTALVFPLVGLMFLFLAPRVSDMIQSFIMKKPFAYGTAISEAIQPYPVRVIRAGLEKKAGEQIAGVTTTITEGLWGRFKERFRR
jgi:hypothetical protein